jgi:hypothetical protein
MRILAIINGEYGARHVENIRANGPDSWSIQTWEAPSVFPLVIDYPEDHLPDTFPPCDLILSFGEHKGVAELLPEIAKLTKAKAVIASVDNEAWLPRGLARQLRGWLEDMGVTCVTPKPLCSLTETHYGVTRREKVAYQAPHITEFARYFGKPELNLTVDPDTRQIVTASVERDAVCGCARFVAERLIGVSADEAEEIAGLHHHHFPCMASMAKDYEFNNDTLMHASGNLLKDNINAQVKPFKKIRYIQPGKLSE